VGSSWDSFRKQVPLCLNHTLTANPNVNTDIGGFFANAYNKTSQDNTATKNPLFQELYVRWMQFGLFCPMMRSHGTEVWREIYHYGKPGEPVYDALLSAIKMRYQLLPYIYSTAWQVSQNDDSFMRALLMDFKEDAKTWDNQREFLFGRSMLVAPVVEALYTPEVANPTNEI
jgi:alpha-D-xyloside xylohydrolase